MRLDGESSPFELHRINTKTRIPLRQSKLFQMEPVIKPNGEVQVIFVGAFRGGNKYGCLHFS